MELLNALAGIAGQTRKVTSDDTIRNYGPTLFAGIKELARQMGYARAWSKVTHDAATEPVYEWLLTADVMMKVMGDAPELWDYRENWADLVELSQLAVRVFGPALTEGHEARFAFCLIDETLKIIRQTNG